MSSDRVQGTALGHSSEDKLWMLTEHGDDTPIRRIAMLRHVAGVTIRAGSNTPRETQETQYKLYLPYIMNCP
jgi:hypothetical protein